MEFDDNANLDSQLILFEAACNDSFIIFPDYHLISSLAGKAQRLACWITYNNCLVGFSCLNADKSYFMGTAYFTRAPSNWVEQVILIILTWKKRNSWIFFVIFVYLVNSAWGFNPEHFCNPNMAKFVSPMSVHKELNYLWLNLVACFDPNTLL